jgi:hypothetical protein
VTYGLNISSRIIMFKISPLLRMCNTYKSVAVKHPKLDLSLSFLQ